MKHKTKKFIYNIVVILLLITGISWVFSRFIHLGRVEYTDNAQIRQLIVPVNSRVQGFIDKICFNEYRPVRKGICLSFSVSFIFWYREVSNCRDWPRLMSPFFAKWEFMHWLIIGLLGSVMLLTVVLFRTCRTLNKLPLYDIDWLGGLLWGLILLSVIFICIYGNITTDMTFLLYIVIDLLLAPSTCSNTFIWKRYWTMML